MRTFRFSLVAGTLVVIWIVAVGSRVEGQQPVTILSGTITSVTQSPDTRQATAANLNAQIQGNVAEDLAVAGNPVQIAGRASTSLPTAVTTGDVVRPWMSINGAGNTILRDSVGDSAMDDANNAVRVTVASGGAVDLADGAASGPGPLQKVLGRTAVPSSVAEGTVISAWATTAGAVHTVPTAAAAPDGAAATCYLASAATTNATNCKASAGVVYDLSVTNTNATQYYLRLYNLAAAPTCSSSTGFIESVLIPAATTGAGQNRTFPVGRAYTAGIGFCLTAGSGTTDNTAAATGLLVSIGYK